jgi:hypothetical protein
MRSTNKKVQNALASQLNWRTEDVKIKGEELLKYE